MELRCWTDQGRRRQRLCTPQRCRRREQIRIHYARGLSLRRLLREHPHLGYAPRPSSVLIDLTYNSGRSLANPTKDVELDIDIGADAKDWSAIQAEQKLKPVEAELRRIEEVSGQVVSEMDYLREREIGLRDTNESTNERVKWFALGTMGMLVGLGVWQVVYLRAYFRSVLAHALGVKRVRLTSCAGRSILSRMRLTNHAKASIVPLYGIGKDFSSIPTTLRLLPGAQGLYCSSQLGQTHGSFSRLLSSGTALKR